MAWLGPAIGPQAFEVGDEVREAFVATDAAAAMAFVPGARRQMAVRHLPAGAPASAALGIRRISGADSCTVSDAGRFFSYRRDGVTGRMASLVWLE
jgi:copper oxidase (laccase) domain-containing protein